MKKIYALLGIALLLIGTVAVGTITVNELYKKVAPTTCEEFLSVGYIWLPKDVSSIFMEDRIVLHFSMINGNEITVYGTVKNGAISKLQCDPFSNHDFEVWMSDLNALELATSEKPITTFVTLWRDDQIRLKANGKDNEKKLVYADQLVARDNEPVPVRIRNIFNKFIE